jgi:flagellar hook-associated protein 1 FlgK
MGLSIGLDTAVTGLRAMQTAIDTTAHNIANADTDGYSRQVVEFRAVPPVHGLFVSPNVPLDQIGLGVDAGRIQRLRDVLLDTQYRDARSLRDDYQARAQALNQTEVTLNEPSDQGLQELLSKFFNGFRDLASQPESFGARSAAIEQGDTLAAAFNRTATMLTNQRTDLDTSVDVKVADVNAKAQEIADLNAQIRRITVAGGAPNDLEDRRDLLLDDLAGLVGATSQAGTDGTVDVYIGSRKLVDNVSVDQLATQPDPANNNLKKVVFASDGADAGITGGEIHGIIVARDQHVTGVLNALNDMASTLITAVNAQHQAGYGLNNATGLAFFTGTNAMDIAINPTVKNNPENLATSDAPDQPGNANVALAIAGVQMQPLMGGGTSTIDDDYRAVVAGLGSASQQASLLADNQDLVTSHLDTARQAVSGVSIDEEMTNLMKAQHAYGASARVISTVDEMLDTLINRTA